MLQLPSRFGCLTIVYQKSHSPTALWCSLRQHSRPSYWTLVICFHLGYMYPGRSCVVSTSYIVYFVNDMGTQCQKQVWCIRSGIAARVRKLKFWPLESDLTLLNNLSNKHKPKRVTWTYTLSLAQLPQKLASDPHEINKPLLIANGSGTFSLKLLTVGPGPIMIRM